jgi:tetratricopeptide (TPR) repeat protein
VKVRTLPKQALAADAEQGKFELPARKPTPGTGKPERGDKKGGTDRDLGGATKRAAPVEMDLRKAAATMRRMRRSGASTHPSLKKKAEPKPELDLTKEFQAAKAKLETGAFGAAREELKQLAVQDPNNKDFRVYMHYAWGREHQAAGRAEEARAEYNRALAIDAGFEPARAALDSLEGPKSRGLLSKWFRK